MDILGIGLPELILIFIILMVVLGPDELITTGKNIGEFFNILIHSEQWEKAKEVNRQVRNLPNRLAREANIEDMEQDIKVTIESITKFPEVPIMRNATSKDQGPTSIPSSAKTASGKG